MLRSVMIAVLLVLGARGIALAAPGNERIREIFLEIDTNGDKKLEFTEIQVARGKLFDRLDTNHNGRLDPGEARIETERERSGAGAGFVGSLADIEARRTQIDTNHDGTISRAEFSAFIPDRLVKADADGDRTLSFLELLSLRGQKGPVAT
ncbi:EF-hand domain-containing protein [Aquabacter sp. CN5-332]|uniref:EF-hand domain-containing protein n=1 Tax=Aquabacter sp. CN5-332 TaxID=3156608 RepID=UPI0032B34902